MSPIPVATIAFVLTFGSAVAATYVREWLPPAHLSKESQDVVRLGIGLVATMTALLLGLVTAAARSAFDVQDVAVRNGAANILTLDRHLARYGPETAPTRDLIRRTLAQRIEADSPVELTGAAPAPIEDIENQILALTPQTDTQRWFKAESLKLSADVVKARWRTLGGGGAVPVPFLVVVIFWLTVTFTSFGLYAPRNATVLAVLGVSAFSVAGAVFLILELDGPFDGIIRVSGAPLQYALTQLSQ
ncbi:MAG TPA: hypothetical protein VFV98_03435 [Vicinamibacterales bacterium]|nr:hypothetical protein [Vicinamibacterales bacterium]